MNKRKYLVLLRSQPAAEKMPRSSSSPEDMQKMFEAYNTWKDSFKERILDMGDKLNPDGRVMTASSVSDGPFIEAKEVVGGYMIVAGADYEEACEVVRACPASQMPGVTLEIRELSGATM